MDWVLVCHLSSATVSSIASSQAAISAITLCELDADWTVVAVSDPVEVTFMHKVVLDPSQDDSLAMGMHSLACTHV